MCHRLGGWNILKRWSGFTYELVAMMKVKDPRSCQHQWLASSLSLSL